jgi:hypothetical protein
MPQAVRRVNNLRGARQPHDDGTELRLHVEVGEEPLGARETGAAEDCQVPEPPGLDHAHDKLAELAVAGHQGVRVRQVLAQ